MAYSQAAFTPKLKEEGVLGDATINLMEQDLADEKSLIYSMLPSVEPASKITIVKDSLVFDNSSYNELMLFFKSSSLL